MFSVPLRAIPFLCLTRVVGNLSHRDIARSSAVVVCREIYGGIAFVVAFVALISAVALANVSISSIRAFVKY